MESAHIEDDDDFGHLPIPLDQGEKSPLISTSPYRTVDLHEPFALEPKNSNKESIDFKFPNFSPEISREKSLELPDFNHIGDPMNFPGNEHTSSSQDDEHRLQKNNQYPEIENVHDIFNSDDLL